MRKHLILSTLLILLIAVLPTGAQPEPHITLLNVINPTCTPTDHAKIAFEFVAAKGQQVRHDWTLTNPRAGTDTASSAGPFDGPLDEQIIMDVLPVPLHTQPSDTLVLAVTATDADGSVISASALRYNCTTGAKLSD